MFAFLNLGVQELLILLFLGCLLLLPLIIGAVVLFLVLGAKRQESAPEKDLRQEVESLPDQLEHLKKGQREPAPRAEPSVRGDAYRRAPE